MDVSVGTRLRVLRKDAGLTQAQLAGSGTLPYSGLVCHLF